MPSNPNLLLGGSTLSAPCLRPPWNTPVASKVWKMLSLGHLCFWNGFARNSMFLGSVTAWKHGSGISALHSAALALQRMPKAQFFFLGSVSSKHVTSFLCHRTSTTVALDPISRKRLEILLRHWPHFKLQRRMSSSQMAATQPVLETLMSCVNLLVKLTPTVKECCGIPTVAAATRI